MSDRHPISRDEIEQSMALIEKAQQLAGHFPDAEALDRARQILEGTTSPEDAGPSSSRSTGSSTEPGGGREPAAWGAHSPRSTRHHW